MTVKYHNHLTIVTLTVSVSVWLNNYQSYTYSESRHHNLFRVIYHEKYDVNIKNDNILYYDLPVFFHLFLLDPYLQAYSFPFCSFEFG